MSGAQHSPLEIAGRKSVQQKNTLQRYFASRGQDPSMTSPLRTKAERGFDDGSLREAQWQSEKAKLCEELTAARSILTPVGISVAVMNPF